jgi:hypothetical protein
MQMSSEKNSSTPASVPPADPFPSAFPGPAADVVVRVSEGSSVPADAGLRADPGVPNASRLREIGGPSGPEPTRFGDWERKGRCIDF